MVGVLPASTAMTESLQHFGYAEAEVQAGHAFLPRGLRLRGHEFHHSQWQGRGPLRGTWDLKQHGRPPRREGWRLAAGVASYFHSYYPAQPSAARAFARLCAAFPGI